MADSDDTPEIKILNADDFAALGPAQQALIRQMRQDLLDELADDLTADAVTS